ncbi:hemin-degrading factor [Flavobacterium sp. '19STA2R22 D10 B1']|uniref:hemin-degrading factor n=1 Tax=Flavobacterium aerium TaxID=3037261 RepID=UPI00278BFD48|nr:ChuX/HutX family heme-like substrate-binding protein [Flavobacterium sp. '19STA2R22 D10 B1']
MNTITNNLKTQWEKLKAENPHIRIRNAAEQLGVSEVELLATNCGENVTRLNREFAQILLEVESLGKVMGLTRNDECVHERKGVYSNGEFNSPHVGLFVNEDIDMRVFIGHWDKAFAVAEKSEHGDRKSLQFFGKDGLALHKIYLTKDSNEEAFDALVAKYKSDNQEPTETTVAIPFVIDEKPDGEIDLAGFQAAWKTLKDTHEFFGMLKKFGVSRTQALRLAPNEDLAKKVDNSTVVKILEGASATKLPIMVFVGNRGNIQIHTGLVRKTMWHNEWFNVMDPDFNLHLDTTKIAQTWIVRKPTEDGVVTAIEVFNEMGEIIVQLFGKRKPGIPELEEWRSLVASV